jgi:hypothetical protein
VDTDFWDLSYLHRGNERQRSAAAALADLGICRDLAAHTPLLAGTVPLDIDVPGSDLDVICHAADPDAFASCLVELYGRHPDFRVAAAVVNGIRSVVANFRHQSWPFEVFAQPLPVVRQNAYLHLIAEARLLAVGGEVAREGIRALKLQGLKTEPAFGRYFNLPGDPYVTLARLASAGEEELRAAVAAG